jgi:hypothetical protein
MILSNFLELVITDEHGNPAQELQQKERPRSRNIHLNSELVKKSRECLEYVIVHELTHLLEPMHNTRFVSLMDKSMPQWRHVRDELNRAPLGHVEWEY